MEPQLSKPYELTFEERPGYLYAHVTAPEMDAFAAIEYLSEVAYECARTRCERLLIERDIPTPIDDPPRSTMHVFIDRCSDMKIAIVGSPTAAESLQRVVGLEAGRGIAVAYLDSLDKAEQWLLQTDGPPHTTSAAARHRPLFTIKD